MEYEVDSVPVTVDTHPTNNRVAVVGEIDGGLHLLACDVARAELGFMWSKKHKAAVRRARFTKDGTGVLSVSKNKALCLWDTEVARKIRCLRKAHTASPYALAIVSEQVCCTGDEAGTVRLWDWRQQGAEPVMNLQDSSEYISSLTAHSSGTVVVATSGDGTILAYNAKAKRLELQSEPMHSDLLSAAFVRHETKLLCGGSDGHIEIFNCGEWGNITDRLESGHNGSVDCITRLANREHDMIATGSLDGTIRLSQVFPLCDFGVIGEHEDGVEEIASTLCGKYLISCGHDGKIKWWKMKKETSRKSAVRKRKRKYEQDKVNGEGGAHFFSDLM